MEICFTYGGVRHCFFVPVLQVPWTPHPGPGPINYPAFLSDAITVATMSQFAGNVVDPNVKGALHAGIQTAVKAMQAHIGQDVQIQLGQAS